MNHLSPRIAKDPRLATLALASGLSFGLVCPALAQCGEPGWRKIISPNATIYGVYAIHQWDPDGDGPAEPLILIGGDIVVDGSRCGLAAIDVDTGICTSVGAGVGRAPSTPSVSAMTTDHEGRLLVGGLFTSAGGVPALNAARWDGSTWTALGNELVDNGVTSLLVRPNGDLIAGGLFNSHSSPAPNAVARWSGTSWLQMGIDRELFGGVNKVLETPWGLVTVGSYEFNSGGFWYSNVSRWNGIDWTPIGSGISNVGGRTVTDAVMMPDDTMVVAGSFDYAHPISVNRIARWDGSTWSPLGTGTSSSIYCLKLMPNGDLLAGGTFTHAGGVPVNFIARWDGAEWHALGDGVSGGWVNAIEVLPNGDVLAGGSFTGVNGEWTHRIAVYSFGSPCCAADYNADTIPDILDFLDFFEDFAACQQSAGPCGTYGDADFNGDTLVDILDFLDFFEAFGAGC